MVLCVMNVSEGRDPSVIAALGAAAILALSDLKIAVKLDHYRAEQTKAVLANPQPGKKGAQKR